MITATHPDEGENELKILQDELMHAAHEYLEACNRYGVSPTKENRLRVMAAGRVADKLAAEYDRLTGVIGG